MVGKDMTRNRPLNPKTRINMQLFNGGYLQCEYLIEEKKRQKQQYKNVTKLWHKIDKSCTLYHYILKRASGVKIITDIICKLI